MADSPKPLPTQSRRSTFLTTAQLHALNHGAMLVKEAFGSADPTWCGTYLVLTRGDARLLARRINECLDAITNKPKRKADRG